MFSYAPGYTVEGLVEEDNRWGNESSFERRVSGLSASAPLSPRSPSFSSLPSSSLSSSSPLSSSVSAFIAKPSSGCPYFPPQRSILAQLSPEDKSYQIAHFYRLHYIGTAHKNFLVHVRGGSVMIVSLFCHDQSHYHLLVRYQGGMDFFTVDKQQLAPPLWKRVLGLEPGLQDILSVVKPDIAVTSILVLPNTSSLQKDIIALDEPAPHSDGIRVGVVYCQAHQTNENEFFSNVETSPEFEEFLDLLGEKIELLGWPHHSGGLDTQKGRSGTHSIYTRWKEEEIMFHVSTLLPLYKKDPQQLERKKHIGNDRVVIIFKDGDAPHPPDSIASKTNQIVILIQVCTEADVGGGDNRGHALYKMSVARKKSVPRFEPTLPNPPFFQKSEAFREFLFSKVLSGLGATHYSREFTALRKLYIESSLKKFALAQEVRNSADSSFA